MYINDWVDRAWYRPIDGTNPLSGTQISHIVPRGNWAVSYTIFEVVAWPSDAGDIANDMGSIWGCALPDYAYFSHSSPSNNYATEFYAYKSVSGNKLGFNILWPTFCTGAEIDGVNGRSVWTVEHTDYYISRWSIVDGTGATFSYDNAYCGTGIQTVGDTGVFAPKDLTRTSDNKILVLDKVSSTSDTFEVKSWNVTSSPGVPSGSLDITGLNGPILRIDCGDYNHPTCGNMLFVLHGNATLGYFMSIYRESELPW